jgi:hypothetical protein
MHHSSTNGHTHPDLLTVNKTRIAMAERKPETSPHANRCRIFSL